MIWTSASRTRLELDGQRTREPKSQVIDFVAPRCAVTCAPNQTGVRLPTRVAQQVVLKTMDREDCTPPPRGLCAMGKRLGEFLLQSPSHRREQERRLRWPKRQQKPA